MSVGADGDVPAGVVEESVVVAAEQDEVVEIGWAAVDPVDDVVDLTPFGGATAAWEGAAVVAGEDCAA